jgi:hypothetical protein
LVLSFVTLTRASYEQTSIHRGASMVLACISLRSPTFKI